jgi:hypothetical protein
MSELPTIIDIQPILNEVSFAVSNGIRDIIYKHNHSHLTRELEKCRAEMEYYKKELENLQKNNTRLNISRENISLNIEEMSDSQSVDNDCTVEKILLQNEIALKNERVSFPCQSDDDVYEAEASEEEEEAEASEEEEEADAEEEEEAEASEEEADAEEEASEAEEEAEEEEA